MADSGFSASCSLKGTRSRFYGYLQSMPSGIVDLPVLWATKENCERTATHIADYVDGPAALGWLRGTHAGDLLSRKTENGMTLLVGDSCKHYAPVY